MLRALVVGLLAILSGMSCSSDADAPAVAAGAVAGKVIDVSGTVTATRDGKTRPLAIGGEVFGNDEIATAADGSVQIELAHNNARWSVESGKTARVDRSLAWKLSKQQASAPTEHATTAAGRNAERTAAETGATASTAAAPESEMAPPAPEPAAAPAAAAPAPPRAPARKAEAAREQRSAPAAPPPPAPGGRGGRSEKGGGGALGGGAIDRADRTRSLDKASTSAPRADASPRALAATADRDADPSAQVRVVIDAQRAALQKCMAGAKLTVVVRVAKGAATFDLGSGVVNPKVRACVAAVIKNIKFPAVDASASIELSR